MECKIINHLPISTHNLCDIRFSQHSSDQTKLLKVIFLFVVHKNTFMFVERLKYRELKLLQTEKKSENMFLLKDLNFAESDKYMRSSRKSLFIIFIIYNYIKKWTPLTCLRSPEGDIKVELKKKRLDPNDPSWVTQQNKKRLRKKNLQFCTIT